MAKMLMGQIDHARNRIRELSAIKLALKPELPEVVPASTVMSQIKKGEVNLTNARLRRAFDNYQNGVTSPRVKKEGGHYDYSIRRNIGGSVKFYDDRPSSLEDALRDLLLEKEITRDVKFFRAEYDHYVSVREAVENKAKEVEDIIVLGDQHAALQALQEFEAFEVE